MTREELLQALAAAEALEKKRKYNKVQMYFQDTGPNSRDNYPNQMDLMRAGTHHRIRAFIGGNGTGKSLWQAIESYYHMSGKYPSWWEGARFTSPINAWLCARENKALREGLQEILFGGIGLDDVGTGIIPREDMLDDNGQIQIWAMAGSAGCVGIVKIKHYTDGVYDGWSKCDFKTYAQGWKEFQGPTRQWIGLDEEPDDGKIFGECLARLRGKDGGPDGHLLATFTPTEGFRDTYLAFVPNGVYPENGTHPDDPSKYTQRIGWSSAPHLTEEYKASCIANWKITDPNNIEARTEGYAAMGSGRVFPIDESFVVVTPRPILSYFKRSYGMDPGQANFAMVWLAQDPNTQVVYVTDEYKRGGVVYLLHAEAVKARGDWMNGGIDPHEAVKPRDTGETVQGYFQSLGLNLMAAKGDPDALRARVRSMFETGALKISNNCQMLLKEIRTYRYDANDPNKIARNQDDHLIDALLYALCVFEECSLSYAQYEDLQQDERDSRRNSNSSDDGRSSITGY